MAATILPRLPELEVPAVLPSLALPHCLLDRWLRDQRGQSTELLGSASMMIHLTTSGVDGGAAAAEVGLTRTEAVERFAVGGRAGCGGDDVFGDADDGVVLSCPSDDARVVVAVVEQQWGAQLCDPDLAAVESDSGSSSCSRAWTCWPSLEVSWTKPMDSSQGPSKLRTSFRPSSSDSSHLKKQDVKHDV